MYDININNINVLLSGSMSPGYHTVVWNATSSPSGVYFIKMQAEDYISTQKVMLVK